MAAPPHLWYVAAPGAAAPVAAGPPRPPSRGGRGDSLTKEEWTAIFFKRSQRVAAMGVLPARTSGRRLILDIDKDLAREYGISFKSVRAGIKRHVDRGGVITVKHGPAKGAGGAPPQTSAAERQAMAQYVETHRGEDREVPRREVQAACLQPVNKMTKIKQVDPVTAVVTWDRQMRLRYPVGVDTVGRILHRADFRARIPAAKEKYTAAERAARLSYAHAALAKPPGYFDGVVYTDEVKLVWARGHTLRRVLGKRVRFVYRRPGERFHPDCVKTRHMRNYMDGIFLKFFVAVAYGQLVIVADGATYLGQSRSAGGQLDQYCYAAYLEDLALNFTQLFDDWNAAGLNPPIDTSEIHLLQDNWRVHNAPEARAAAIANDIVIVPDQPTRSPDLNPIEHVFKCLADALDAMYLDPAKANVTRDEFCADVNACLHALQVEGTLAKICSDESMRNRCNAVIAANGYATSY